MNIEYANYDIASNEQEFKENINAAIKYKPSVISVLPSFIKLAKSSLATETDSLIKLAAIIDYPLGVMDNIERKNCLIRAMDNGAQIIEMVVPSYLLCNRRYEKLKQDIVSSAELCEAAKVEVRYVFDYSVFNQETVLKASHLLHNNKINTILMSTAFRLDDIADHIIAASVVKKKIKDLNIIINGNIWNSRHIELIKKIENLESVRCYSINSLDKLANM